MRELPLYPDGPNGVMSSGQELEINSSCNLCRNFETARSVCLPADGAPGGLLAVGKMPSKPEDMAGRVNVCASGVMLRSTIAKYWSGPVVFDNAVRCFPGNRQITENQIEICRPYLRRVLREAQPTRILALGAEAMYALLGRTAPMMSIRRGYAYILPPDGEHPVPVFFVPHPAAGERNPIVGREIVKDLAHVLTCDDPDLPPWDEMFYLVETAEDAQQAAVDIRAEAEWFAYDLEWGGVPHTDYFEIVTAAVCPSGTDTAWVWPRAAMNDPKIFTPLLELLADGSVGKIGHNVKGDNNAITDLYGVEVRNTHGDTYLWRRLLQADANAKLGVCAELVGMGGAKEENDAELEKAKNLIRRERRSANNGQACFDFDCDPALIAAIDMPDDEPEKFAYVLVPGHIRNRYCARDAVATARLGDHLFDELRVDVPRYRVWKEIFHSATDAIGQMQRWGVATSRDSIEAFHIYTDMKISEVKARLDVYPGYNFSSPRDVARLLFDDLGLKPPKNQKGERTRSTNKLVMTTLKSKHPIVADIMEFRRLEKLQSNYGRNMATHIRSDGRIYPEVKIAGARTGRLSCINPPLYTLPKSFTEEGKMVKRAFVAPPGKKIAQLDYSQIELRILAMLSGDPVMTAMFESGEDFHRGTAKLIAETYWGISPDEVDDHHRSQSKSVNFGLAYGMSDRGLADRLGCSVEKAAQLKAAILGKFSHLSRWLEQCVRDVRNTGYSSTWWDGQEALLRPLFNIRSNESKKRSTAENSAKNTPIQGTAALFMVAAICKIVDWIINNFIPAKLVLTVYDSAVLEIEDGYEEEVIEGVTEIMQSFNSMEVPLKVDREIGSSLGDLTEWIPAV